MVSNSYWKLFKDRAKKEKMLKTNLSDDDREVLENILFQMNEEFLKEAFNALLRRYSSVESGISSDDTLFTKIKGLAFDSEGEIIFSYIELFIDGIKEGFHVSTGTFYKDFMIKRFSDFFESRGLLYSFFNNPENGKLEIYPIASEKMRDLHTQTPITLLEEGWHDEAELINQATAHFKKGKNSYGSCLKALYSALENSLKHVLKELGVPEEQYVSKTVSPLLNLLQANNFFNGPDADYLRHISESIMKMSAYVAGKRKKGDHPQTVKPHEVLFCIYGVDNCICYLISELRDKR